MEADELLAAKQALREFAEQNDLGWVLEELDEAVALGVMQVKPLRQTTRKGQQVYEEVRPGAAGTRGPKRAEEFLTRRPMTELEQVEALIIALRRVLVDLDVVAQTAVEQLNGLPAAERDADTDVETRPEPALTAASAGQTRVATVQEIDFLPDDGSPAGSVTTEVLRHAKTRRTAVASILDRLLREVRQ